MVGFYSMWVLFVPVQTHLETHSANQLQWRSNLVNKKAECTSEPEARKRSAEGLPVDGCGDLLHSDLRSSHPAHLHTT